MSGGEVPPTEGTMDDRPTDDRPTEERPTDERPTEERPADERLTNEGSNGRISPAGSVDSIGSARSLESENDCEEANRNNTGKNEKKVDQLRG